MTLIKRLSIAAVCAITLSVVLASFYTLKETQQALVFQFGKVVKVVDDAGLHFKVPIVQTLQKLPGKNYVLSWDGDRGLYPTSDKQVISRDFFAKWRIADAKRYYESTAGGKRRTALRALDTIFNDSTKNVISGHPFIDNVRSTNTELPTLVNFGSGKETFVNAVTIGREGMVEAIYEVAAKKAHKFGIEIIDLKTKRVNYSDKLRPKVYDKLSRERLAAAEKFLGDGKAEYNRIVAEANNRVKQILSSAQKEADTILGQAEGKATKILAKMDQSPEFFEFQAKLSTLKAGIKPGDSVYIATDSPLFKLLKEAP